jgi:hypothetical protein
MTNEEKIAKAKPASFVNIAFDTGRVFERQRILTLLEEFAELPEHEQSWIGLLREIERAG